MGLETGTYISDLVTTNPISTDLESQGDDHLRLIKQVLQNTFPGANRAFPIPTNHSLSGNYTLLSTDQNKVFRANTTSGGFEVTLPTLAAGDAGWEVTFWKTTADGNAWFIVGTQIYSGQGVALTRLRRAIPFIPFRCIWTGDVWVVERCIGAPVGSVIPFFGSALPAGFEWPNGQTLASASTIYPVYNAVRGNGTTPDLRQRVLAGSSLGGADPSRITTGGSGINGNTLEAAGGAQTVTVGQTNLPNVNFSVSTANVSTGTISISDPGHTHNLTSTGLVDAGANYAAIGGGSLQTRTASQGTFNTATVSATTGISASPSGTWQVSGQTAASGGSGTALNNMPPTIICNFILVVE